MLKVLFQRDISPSDMFWVIINYWSLHADIVQLEKLIAFCVTTETIAY